MSVLISGALINGAGTPITGCHIILKSRINTSEVIRKTVADVITGNNGEYSIEVREGKYFVYLKPGLDDEYCVGEISVDSSSEPGTLNAFLLRETDYVYYPESLKKLEEAAEEAVRRAENATGPQGQKGDKGDPGAPGQGTELLTTANTWTQAQTFDGGINGNLTVNGNGSFNDVQIRSDKRNKRNLVKLDNALDRIEALTGYLYEIQYSTDGWQTSVGLIAQDAQKALPELVTEDDDMISGEKRLRLNYNGIIALLVEGFKKLRHEIKELKEK